MTDEREPFYIVEEQFRASVERLLAPLSDDDLNGIYELFDLREHGAIIPVRYRTLAPRIRAHIKHEQRRRQAQPTPQEATSQA